MTVIKIPILWTINLRLNSVYISQYSDMCVLKKGENRN